ncbi:MAG: hypothetical protein QM796_07805, partial [Chthoniobacteraceae bacterium]
MLGIITALRKSNVPARPPSVHHQRRDQKVFWPVWPSPRCQSTTTMARARPISPAPAGCAWSLCQVTEAGRGSQSTGGAPAGGGQGGGEQGEQQRAHGVSLGARYGRRGCPAKER